MLILVNDCITTRVVKWVGLVWIFHGLLKMSPTQFLMGHVTRWVSPKGQLDSYLNVIVLVL